MPTDLLPFEFEIRTAKTGNFYVAARDATKKWTIWAQWVFFSTEAEATQVMYELELARVGRTWYGPHVNDNWKLIGRQPK